MWLVLCHPGDAAAVWAARGLAGLRRGRVRLATIESLIYAPRSTHRIGVGGVDLVVALAHGEEIRGSDVRGVLNRVTHYPDRHLGAAIAADRDYAREEGHAMLLSWLHGLERAVNPPHPLGLGGAWRSELEWNHLAAVAGFATRPHRQRVAGDAEAAVGAASETGASEGAGDASAGSSPAPYENCTSAHVVVAGRRTFAVDRLLPRGVAEASLRLARLAGAPLLGIDLERAAGGRWTFHGATCLPDLRRAGLRLIPTLAEILGMPGRRRA